MKKAFCSRKVPSTRRLNPSMWRAKSIHRDINTIGKRSGRDTDKQGTNVRAIVETYATTSVCLRSDLRGRRNARPHTTFGIVLPISASVPILRRFDGRRCCRFLCVSYHGVRDAVLAKATPNAVPCSSNIATSENNIQIAVFCFSGFCIWWHTGFGPWWPAGFGPWWPAV